MEKKWSELSAEEKRKERIDKWLAPKDLKFNSPEAEKAYYTRAKRMADIYQVGEPDRVPVQMPFGVLPLTWAGSTLKAGMYDYEELRKAWTKFLHDFDMDTYSGPGMVLPGKIYDLLDYKLYKWPGHGLPDKSPSFQYTEGEYMMADEYDDLIQNPSDFWMRTYMPRIFGLFEPLTSLGSLTDIIEMPAGYFMPFSRPDMQQTLQTLIDIGKEFPKWLSVVADCTIEAQQAGVPSPFGGTMAKAPFDIVGDTLRGTRGVVLDMYEQPEKLLEAIDVLANLTIKATISAINNSGGIMAMFPLHKGADGFMSDEQFSKFYWPSLRKVIMALIDEGIITMLFAEGSYMTRLETVNEFPKGAVAWMFDQTDMATAKRVLGDKCCIAGNVPTSLISTGTPESIKEYCRKLIEDCAPGGGYMLSAGSEVHKAPQENVRAMMEAAKEYGVYK